MKGEGLAFPEYGLYPENIDLKWAHLYHPAWSTAPLQV